MVSRPSSRTFAKEMMLDRGGTLVDENDEEATWELPSKKGTKTVLMIWKEAVCNEDILDVNARCKSIGCSNAILIHSGKITPQAVTMITGLKAMDDSLAIEVFPEATLLYNPTKHVLVPKHIVCSSETKKQICTQYSVTAKELPVILTSDPIARWYGFVKGQLIEIHRPRIGSSGYDLTYRIVG